LTRRWADWALFGGPRQWNPWRCGVESYRGDDVNFPLPHSREEVHRWTNIGSAKRYHALFPGTPQVGTLRVLHQQPPTQTGTATFGPSFVVPAGPVALGGSLTDIPYAHTGGTGTDIEYHFPLGVLSITILDMLI